MDIKYFRNLEELKVISDDWDALLAQSPNNTLSLTWDWIRNWINVYTDSDQLLCIAIYDKQKLVGLAPLWVKQVSYLGIIKLRILGFIGSEEICPDHLDFIIAEKYLNKIPKIFWEYIFGPLHKYWDIWEYHYVPSDSQILHQFCQMAGTDARCLKYEIEGYSICPYISLTESWDNYVSSLSGNQRRALKVSTDLIEQAGTVEWDVCTDISDLDRLMATHIRLHRLSWQDRGQSGSFNTEMFNTFHREFAENRVSRNELLLCSLNLDGNPIGSFYGFEYNKIMYYYLLGVDRAAVPKASIGRVVIGYCVKLSIERGCHELDLLRGFESYKYDWTKRERREWLVTFYNRSVPALLLLLRQYCRRFLKHAVKYMQGLRKKDAGGSTPEQ